MSNIARLGAILSLDTKEFVKGVDAAQLKSKEFKQNLKETQQVLNGIKSAANATALAMLAFGAIAAKTADEISDLADANDTTIGKVLELKHALVSSGGDAEKLNQLFSSFTNAVDGAAQGSDKLRDSFKAVGVSTKDLGLLSSDDLRTKALDGLAKVEDTVTRNAIAMQLFGKAAKGVDFRMLGEEAKNAAGHYDKQAAAIKSAADAAQKLELFFGDMKIAAMAAMKPITDLINVLPSEDRIEAMTTAFQVLGTTLAIAFGVKAVRGVIQLGNAIRMIAITNPWLLALTAAATVGAYVLSDKLNPLPEDQAYPEKGGAGGGRPIEQSARDKMVQKYKEEFNQLIKLNELKKQFAEENQQNTMAELELEGKKYKLSEGEFRLKHIILDDAKAMSKISETYLTDRASALRELNLASAEEHALAQKNYELKVKIIEETYNREIDYQKQITDKREELLQQELERQKSWSAGWEAAFKEYTEASERASDRGRAAFQSVMSNMETALRTFVDTGKFAFKDFVGSVIKDLIYMEAKAQASAIFRQIWSAASGMFGGTSSAGGGGGGSTVSFGGSQTMGFASGGYVDKPSIVGENGAELFVPNTPGTIIPNGSWQQMAAAGGNNGGMTINGNYIANMSAIDTQSGMQFLAKNKDTIWAAYQSANRSVPISR
jgi:lambda family phage tail tape measure protein